ncbi:MAG: PulJ/GspJ family protein [Actinomycetota bacterium]
MRRLRDEAGFTILELLVAMSIFAIISVILYQVVDSTRRSQGTTEAVVDISEEARMGLNRMIRDLREAHQLTNASPTTFTVEVDFNRDGVLANTPSDYEILTYTYVPGVSGSPGQIRLSSGGEDELLVDGVQPVGSDPVFSYFSSSLEYDTGPVDGRTDLVEINAAPRIGNNNGLLDAADELQEVDSLDFAFRVDSGDHAFNFSSIAQMRNNR